MPSVQVHPPSIGNSPVQNPLPQLLHTPSGLALLELQGTFNLPPEESEEDSAEVEGAGRRVLFTPVGRLVFPSYESSAPDEKGPWMKHVFLYVGKHQRLSGEVKKLPKAIGVMRKREKQRDSDPDELEITEIVKYKIVFSQRPEPVGVD